MARSTPRLVPFALLLACSLAAASCSRGLSRAPAAPVVPFAGTSTAVVVTLAPGADAQAIARSTGATLVRVEAGGLLALFAPAPQRAPEDLAARLARTAGVATAEPNSWVRTAESHQKSFAFDDGQGSWFTTREQASLGTIGLDAAHAVSLGDGVKIAVLDTGADPSHPLLAGRIEATADFVDPANTSATEFANGIDDDGNGEIDEAYGHGTHVAGILAVTAPAARLLVCRVLDADGRGDVLAVAAGIRWAVRMGADVVNLSLGTTAHVQAIDEALLEAHEAGVLVVAAAGNRAAESPVEYPARTELVFAVAATDSARRPAAFTSFGEFIAISAPGVGVRSAYPGGAWRLWSGTSMATPFVAGTLALLRARHPVWTEDKYRERLRTTSAPLDEPSSGRRERLGRGVLHAGAALAPDSGPGERSGIDAVGGDPDALRR